MDQIDWKRVKHFKESESWGDPTKIHPILVYTLDGLRELLNCPIIITSGTQGLHAPNSQHYLGLAADCVLDCDGSPFIDIIFKVLKFPFMGVGFYPKWVAPGMAKPLGLHLDFRHSNHRALWIGISEKDGRTVQYEVNQKNLIALGLG